MLAEGPGEPGKGHRRHGEVVHELRAAAQLTPGLAITSSRLPGSVGAEAAAGEQQALGERVPGRLLRLGPELGQHVVDVLAEVLVRHVAAAVPDEQPLPG